MVAPGSLPFRFHPEARLEFDAQVNWFADESLDVAQRFLDTVWSRIEDVRWMPFTQPKYLHDTRKANLGRFPVRLIYRVKNSEIQIVALAHTSRNPGYWRERLGDEV